MVCRYIRKGGGEDIGRVGEGRGRKGEGIYLETQSYRPIHRKKNQICLDFCNCVIQDGIVVRRYL